MEAIQIIKEIVAIVAPIIGLIIAALGVFTWRMQLKGKTQYELARRLLKAVYELREAIKVVRNPAIVPEEVVSAMKDKGFSDDEISNEVNPLLFRQDLVYEKRWKGISNALSTLEVEALEAEVIWGEEIQDKAIRFKRCIYKLNINLKRNFRQESSSRNYDHDKMEKIEQIIWEGGEDSNPFDREINESIKEIEDFLRPYLTL